MGRALFGRERMFLSSDVGRFMELRTESFSRYGGSKSGASEVEVWV